MDQKEKVGEKSASFFVKRSKKSKNGQKHSISSGKSTIGRKGVISFPGDRFMSKVHAYLDNKGSDCFLSDSNSKNGTMLNGKKILQETKLSNGDIIICGETELIFNITK